VSFDALANDLDGVLRDHMLLDCPYIGLGSMPQKFTGSLQGYKEFAKAITPIAQVIRDNGRTFVYHNHNFEFARFGELTGMEILMEECGSAVQFEPDTYWIQAGGGDVVKWLRKLSGRVEVVHFKDMVYDLESRSPVMAEVGEGNLNWTDIIDVCRDIGVLWHIVEQDVCQRDPYDSLKISLGNLARHGLE
jgi:sugar phosphate isomerase/epimerase